MSFDIEDPLAGILSDGSDDSFFDDDILGKKKTAKKKGAPIAEKKKSLFDLGDGDKSRPSVSDDLGLTDSNKVSSIEDNKLSGIDNPKSPGPFKRTLSKESFKIQSTDFKNKPLADVIVLGKSPAKTKISSSADKLVILGELTTENKKETVRPLEKGKSSQSLLNDILGGPSTKTSGSAHVTKPVTAAKSQEFDFDSFLGKNDSKPTLSLSKNAPQKQNIKVDNPMESTAKKITKPSEDWLGIFHESDDENKKNEEDSGMPAWLVGETKKIQSSENENNKKRAKEAGGKEKPKEVKDEQEKNDFKEKENKLQVHTNLEHLTNAHLPSTMTMQNNSESIAAEGATLYLQQQESQLMVALQLKAQEEKLAAMQTRQKEAQRVQREAALTHHAQLDAMLRRQAEQRQQMQSIIAKHQERITQRIKALLGTANVENEDNINSNDDEYESSPVEKKDSPHMKEKKQLLQLVQSLQENHDKEIDLMETSYRRQLAFLEVSINQSEERMKEESDKLERFYIEKIHWLEEHHNMYKKLTEDNLMSLTERHRTENEMLRQQHSLNVKVLQEHHTSLMENIKRAMKQEQSLIQDSTGFSSELHELVIDVKESKYQWQQLVGKVQALSENTQRDTEKSLQTREAQINDLIQQVKKERENIEIEKSESRDMVKMLETRLKQMTTMIEEETVALKQKKMEFEFDKATFSKQTEFAKNVLKKQDEEIKILKEDIQKEYQEKVTQIDEERAKALKDSAAIAKEKASIQSLKQELEKTKAELQGQLEEIMEERSRLNLEKQQIHMEEQRILAKSRDLDILAKTAIEKQAQADKKLGEAEFIQRKYEDRIRRIQDHVVSLNTREKQIAREKVALSRERLTLHNEKKQIENRLQCSLCKSAQNIPAYNFEANYTLPETFLNVPVSRDYGGTNVRSAMNAIEQEMAHIMGRSYGLRHATELGNVVNNDERYANDRVAADDNHNSVQSGSGTFKDYMDPKFMMLRLDVQQVLSNLSQSKKDDVEEVRQNEEE